MASFGRPVVPEVQSQKPGESSQVSYGSPAPGSAASTSSKLVAATCATAGGGEPSATITCASSGARSTSSEASGALSGETASTRALASAIESARSGAGSNGFSGSGMAPIRIAARKTTTSSRLSSRTSATRSSGRTPIARRPLAARQTRSCSSAYVTRPLSASSATRPPSPAASRRSTRYADALKGSTESLPGMLSPARSRAAPAALPSPARRHVPARGRGRPHTTHGRPPRR